MKIRWIAALSAVVALTAALPAASAIMVSFNPAGQVVKEGSSTTVDLVISGLGDGLAPSLSTFDLDISFDSAILGFQGASFGDQLDLFGLGSIQSVTPGAGMVNLFELSFDLAEDLDDLQLPSFVLATLSFDVLDVGNSALNLSVNALGDSQGDPLPFEQPVAGSVTAVPEPASLALVAIGMLGIMSLSARRRKGRCLL